jgi:hypothetical protein
MLSFASGLAGYVHVGALFVTGALYSGLAGASLVVIALVSLGIAGAFAEPDPPTEGHAKMTSVLQRFQADAIASLRYAELMERMNVGDWTVDDLVAFISAERAARRARAIP